MSQKLPKDSRILITRVIEGSAADKIGIKPGDIILSINGKEILSGDDLSKEIESSKGSEIEIKVLRDDKEIVHKGELGQDTLGIRTILCRREKMLSPFEMKEDLDAMFDAIEEIHPNPYFSITKDKFDKLKKKAYDKIEKPMSISEFWKVAAPLVSSIKDGHTSLWIPEEVYLYEIYCENKNIVFPLKLRIIKDTALVQKNFSDAPIKEGDLILSINKIPMEKIIEDFILYVSGELRHFRTSKIQMDFPILLSLIYGFKGPFYVKVKDADGKENEYKVEGGDKNTYQKMKTYDIIDSNFYFEEIPELKTGIIKFNYFKYRERFDEFLKNTFSKIKEREYKYLVIDLRDNGGGNSQIAEDLLDYITDKPYRFFGGSKLKVSKYTLPLLKRYLPNREFEVGSVLTSDEEPLKSPSENPLRFKGKVFVLISNYTFSTASGFAAVIKDFKIGTLVGEETGGIPSTYGDIWDLELPNSHIGLGVSFQYFVRPNGDATYIPHGILPDIPVQITPEDIRTGKDPVMEKVKEIINYEAENM